MSDLLITDLPEVKLQGLPKWARAYRYGDRLLIYDTENETYSETSASKPSIGMCLIQLNHAAMHKWRVSP